MNPDNPTDTMTDEQWQQYLAWKQRKELSKQASKQSKRKRSV